MAEPDAQKDVKTVDPAPEEKKEETKTEGVAETVKNVAEAAKNTAAAAVPSSVLSMFGGGPKQKKEKEKEEEEEKPKGEEDVSWCLGREHNFLLNHVYHLCRRRKPQSLPMSTSTHSSPWRR